MPAERPSAFAIGGFAILGVGTVDGRMEADASRESKPVLAITIQGTDGLLQSIVLDKAAVNRLKPLNSKVKQPTIEFDVSDTVLSEKKACLPNRPVYAY